MGRGGSSLVDSSDFRRGDDVDVAEPGVVLLVVGDEMETFGLGTNHILYCPPYPCCRFRANLQYPSR